MTVAERLIRARKNKGLSQQELADKLGWKTRARLSNYEKGKRTLRAEDIVKIAKILDVSAEWLQFGSTHGFDDNLSVAPHLKWVPLVSWVKAGNWCQMEEYSIADEVIEYIPTTQNLANDAIALRVEGDSMTSPMINSPSFPEGSIIIVERNPVPKNKDFVIAMLPDSSEATFKQYIVDAGVHYLKPLNPQYPMIKLPRNAAICGVVVANLNFYK